MELTYRNFFRSFYIKTGGFIPMSPLNTSIYPGDFFQIHDGEILLLGNIYRKGIIDSNNIDIGKGSQLNPVSWSFSDGVSKPYSGRGNGTAPIIGEFEFSKQILAFNSKGSFFFKSDEPESIKILNWRDIQQQLILKMTQTIYSFRNLYMVTETVAPTSWTLALSGSEKGELEIATDKENFGLVDIFGHHSAKTIQSKDIEYYHRETHKKPSFFKAKKLVVQNEKIDVFISDLIAQMHDKNKWANDFFEYDFFNDSYQPVVHARNADTCVLDMLQANELNPNTALLYFKWEDINLDDVEKLFFTYGKQ